MIRKDLATMEAKLVMLERHLSPKELKNPAIAQKLKSIRASLLKFLKHQTRGNL